MIKVTVYRDGGGRAAVLLSRVPAVGEQISLMFPKPGDGEHRPADPGEWRVVEVIHYPMVRPDDEAAQILVR